MGIENQTSQRVHLTLYNIEKLESLLFLYLTLRGVKI